MCNLSPLEGSVPSGDGPLIYNTRFRYVLVWPRHGPLSYNTLAFRLSAYPDDPSYYGPAVYILAGNTPPCNTDPVAAAVTDPNY